MVGQECSLAKCQLSVLFGVNNIWVSEGQFLQTEQ